MFYEEINLSVLCVSSAAGGEIYQALPISKNKSVTLSHLRRYGFNVDTYGNFYKENRERLYAYLLRMTGEQQTALDLLQESFARYLARYGRREYNKALLYTIARNAALDTFRRQKMTGRDAENCLYSGADPEQQVIDQEKFNQTMSAIAKLAPLDRELISLVTATDLTYQEIGRVLKISEANVKVRIHRARTKLRAMLASGGE